AGTGLTYTGTAFNVNASQNITTLSNLTGNGLVYTSGGTGALNTANFSANTIPYVNGAGTAILYTATSTLNLGIAGGGTNATSQTTNGVNYFDGTRITSGTGLTFTGTNLGISSTTPFAKLAVTGSPGTNPIFEVASSSIGTSFLSVAGNSGIVTMTNASTTNISTTYASSTRAMLGTLAVGLASASTYLDVSGSNVSNTRSLRIRGGDDATAPADSYQLLFSHNNTTNYSHNIRTRHDSGVQTGNAMDFYLWDSNIDVNTDMGTKLTLTLLGNGNVGVGSTTPGTILSLGDTGANTVNISAVATSTFGSGVNIRTGCFAVNGVCVGGSAFSNTIANGGTATTTFYNRGVVFYNGALGTLSQASSSNSFDYDVTANKLILANASTTNITSAYASTTSQIISGSLTIANLSGFLKATAGVVATSLIDLANDVTGILGVGSGGTGWATGFTANALLLGNGTNRLATTTAGTNGQVLALVSGVPTWVATTTLANISGTLGTANGGTATTTWMNGALTFYDSTLTTLSQASTQAALFFDKTNSRLGVGTTTPQARLSVNGATDSFPLEVVGNWSGVNAANINSAITSFGDVSRVVVRRANGTQASPTGILNNDSLGAFQFRGFNSTTGFAATNNAQIIAVAEEDFTSTTMGTRLEFRVMGPGTVTLNTGIVIKGSGNIGIGTSSPQAKLEVVDSSVASTTALYLSNFGSATSSTKIGLAFRTNDILNNTGTTTANMFSVYQGGTGGVPHTANGDLAFSTLRSGSLTEGLRLTAAGNVGIGTSTPGINGEILSIYKDAAPYLVMTSGAGGEKAVFGATGGDVFMGSLTNTKVNLRVNNSAKLTIDTTGNVGIASSTPWGLLSVNPNALTTGVPAFVVGSSTATNFIVAQSGNVGIGTTTPQWPLSVFSATGPQLALSEGTGESQWTFRSVNGNLYIATTTIAGTATSTVPQLTINSAGTVIIGDGTGKLTLGTFDPVYTVNGTAYATYAAGMIGIKEEVTGSAEITTPMTAPDGSQGYSHTIDFDEEAVGGDLWLFAQTTQLRKNIDKLVVLLSAEGNTKVWYQVDRAERKVHFLSNSPTRISYRMTAPRFDHESWSNLNHDGVPGFRPPSNEVGEFHTSTSTISFGNTALLVGTTTIAELIADAGTVTPVKPWTSAMSGVSAGLKNAMQVLNGVVVEAYEGAQYFADGIFKRIFAQEVHTDTLCVSDASGETCITKSQLDALIAGAANSGGGSGGNGNGGGGAPDTEAPVITILGNNPAYIYIGDSYADLGATVTDNVDQNLGIVFFVNDVEVTQVEIDTAVVGEQTVRYQSTDQAGNVGTATRTVIVQESAP
ncbi:DUF5011 domain-containing protein, partial [Patescibacteria group bacterium]|nr:DUF5011 domain-containing protein [Patescibacteria group bacterium]